VDLSCTAHEAKVPVIRKPEYTVAFEQINPETTFVHCTIHVPWTGRVRRQLTADWNALVNLHGGPFYAIIPPDNFKRQQFARTFGFERAAILTDLTTGQTNLIYRN
jgi:hypothetical protein